MRPPGRPERLVHLLVDRVQRRHVEQPAADPRLIGRDDDAEAGVIEPRDRFEAAGNRTPLVRRLDELIAVVVDHAVAVQDDQPGGAGRATPSEASWTMATSDRELRDVGDAIHRLRDPAQQRESVGADRAVVGHHQHVVEEAVDGGLRAGERQQRGGVVAAAAVSVDDGLELLEREIEVVLGAVVEATRDRQRRRLGRRTSSGC